MAKRATAPAGAVSSQPLDQSQLKKHAGYFLARARFIALRTFAEHVGEVYELRPVEFSLMILLGSNRNVTQKQLARALGMAQPNMTTILRRLEVRSLIERTRSEQDKRMQYVTLTPAGTQLIRQAIAASKGMDQGWLGALTAAEQAMLVALLEKVSMPARMEESDA